MSESPNLSLTPISPVCNQSDCYDFRNAAVWAAWDNPDLISKSGHGGPRPNSGGSRPGSGRKPKFPSATPEPEGVRWYCCYIKPGKDLLADIESRLAGFTVFAPTIWKQHTPTRRDAYGIIRVGLPDRVEPLFRRYFFTQFDRTDFSWTKLLHLPGAPVQRIISSSNGRPIPVSDDFIDKLKSRLHANGCLYPEPPKTAVRLEKGTKVKPLEGAFSDHGWVGELSEMSDGKRVKVLLQMMGREVPVVMDQAAVEVIS